MNRPLRNLSRACAVLAATSLCHVAAADFVDLVVSRVNVQNSGQALVVYTVAARFNGPTDTLVKCFNLASISGELSLAGFWHKDHASYNSDTLMQGFGTWNPSATGSAGLNRPYDSYLTIGTNASVPNFTAADVAWLNGANADSRGWNRPDVPTNGTVGWFNPNQTNLQGRVGNSPGLPATDVRIAQFVLSATDSTPRAFSLSLGFTDGSPGAAVQIRTDSFALCGGQGPWFRDVDGDGVGLRDDGFVWCSTDAPAGYSLREGDNCPSIANPDQADCNANGIGDVCDIATGLSSDCDGDSRPDECEGIQRIVQVSTLRPVSSTVFAEHAFSALPPAYGRQPRLTIEATADLGAANDGLLVSVDGAAAGAYFLTDGVDCPSTPNSATISYEVPGFNALVADGTLVVRATAFGAVNSANCGAGGGVRFRLEYDGLPAASDCNGNGQLDSCEIGTGSAQDCNANGRPDSCDLASGDAVDCNGNGQLDSCEIGTGSAQDCNANGRPDSCDLASGDAVDCNGNGRPDSCDLATGASTDLNANAVPDDCEFVVGGSGYPTIQAAVAAAPPGAVIRVGPGTYAGPIVVDSKPVSLVSIAGAASTTISGAGAASSIVAIRSAAAGGSVVDGFTLRDGTAGTAAFGVRVGGAMFLDHTAGAIRNCRFVGNSSEYGGGIYGIGFDGVIEGCVFEGNAAQFNSGGVQLGFGGTCVFRNNRLVANTAQVGGGMHIVNWYEGPVTAVSLEHCEFVGNAATLEGGALSWYGSVGADLPVSGCEIVGNSAPDAAFSRIGGVLSFAMANSRFCRNTPADVVGSIVDLGGNIFSSDCNANGVCDADEIAAGTATDCDGNGTLDACDLAAGGAFDCNANGVLDSCDIAAGTSGDVDSNGVPDDCKPDCDGDRLPDAWEIAQGLDRDCDLDGVPDSCEIAQDHSKDKNANGRLDGCELARGDLNLDGIVNAADLSVLLAFWGVPQSPVGDLDGDGQVAGADLAIMLGNWGTTP